MTIMFDDKGNVMLGDDINEWYTRRTKKII
jgi:hypothetical protein